MRHNQFFLNGIIRFISYIIPVIYNLDCEIAAFKLYMRKKQIELILFGRGFTWMDTGTHEALADATNFVKSIEEHQGLKVSCIEEIAYRNGWISKDQLIEIGNTMGNNEYGKHLLNVAAGKII